MSYTNVEVLNDVQVMDMPDDNYSAIYTALSAVLHLTSPSGMFGRCIVDGLNWSSICSFCAS